MAPALAEIRRFLHGQTKFDHGTPTKEFTEYIRVPLSSVSLAVRLLDRRGRCVKSEI